MGIRNLGFVKAAAWGDYNNDGWPDLYLSRYLQPNLLLRNEGPGEGGWRFTDVTAEAGVAEPKFSFPTWFFDYDNDGWLDCYFGTGLPGMNTLVPNRMYRNDRGLRFQHVTDRTRGFSLDGGRLRQGVSLR